MAELVDDPRIGHTYKPDWIDVAGEVLSVSSKGAVRFWFHSGHKRWFKPSTFRDHFTHIIPCYMCGEGDSNDKA